MLARKTHPPTYISWNTKWGAPFGYAYGNYFFRKYISMLIDHPLLASTMKHSVYGYMISGPFSSQPNNSTRSYEYPWAYHISNPSKHKHIVDIGGGFGGLQFVVAKTGAKVTNVDPGDKEHSWKYTTYTFSKLNRAFNTDVKLVQTTLDKANIPESSVDIVYCISVIEHLDNKSRIILLKNVKRIPKPGGLLVITLDLFLDLEPFTNKKVNRWGQNVRVSQIEQDSGLKLDFGDKKELYGYPEFKADTLLSNLGEYLIGTGYPVLAQLFTLRKT